MRVEPYRVRSTAPLPRVRPVRRPQWRREWGGTPPVVSTIIGPTVARVRTSASLYCPSRCLTQPLPVAWSSKHTSTETTVLCDTRQQQQVSTTTTTKQQGPCVSSTIVSKETTKLQSLTIKRARARARAQEITKYDSKCSNSKLTLTGTGAQVHR